MTGEAVPQRLRLVLAFLNTRYGHTRLHDAWPDRAAMADWLREQELIPPDIVVTEGDYRRAITLREGLRQRLRGADEDDAASTETLTILNHIAQQVVLKVAFDGPSTIRLLPESGGVDGVLARVLGDVYSAQDTGILARLKICHNSACSKAFFDASKNQSGVWCSTRRCGNRMHARAYRQQQKQVAATTREAHEDQESMEHS